MRTADYTQLGKFPFTQEALAFLQTAYTELLPALISDIPNGVPVVLSGMEFSEGVNAVMTDGFFYYNGEIYKFTGGTLSPKTFIQYYCISLDTAVTPLTFQNSVTYDIYSNKTGSFTKENALSATKLDLSTLKHWSVYHGPRTREDTFTVVASVAAAITGNIYYRKNWLTNSLQVHGNLTVNAASTSFPPIYYQLTTLDTDYRPNTTVPFQMLVRYHNNLFLDSEGDGYITAINAELRTDGLLNAAPIAPAGGVDYTVSFNVIIPLD